MSDLRHDDPLLYRALFETAPDAMVVVSRDGRIVLANPQSAQLFDYPLDLLVGQPVEMLVPDDSRGSHVAQRTGYMERPRIRPMGAGQELVGRRRDGSQFPIEIALSPIGIEGETLFAASIRDISETRRQRQALARARYDGFVAQAGQLALETPDFDTLARRIATLVLDALDALDVPEAAAVSILLTQPPRGETVATAARVVDPAFATSIARDFDPGTTEARAHDLEGYLRAPERIAGERAGDFRGGRYVPILEMARPAGAMVVLASEARGFDRDFDHFLQVLANVLATAALRHRAQDQLAHAQRLDAVGQLTGGIAHDFNNLLTVISGNLQLLETEVAADDNTADVIARALRAVGRGAELTRKLLAFARRQRLNPVAIDAHKLLDDIGHLLKRTLGETIRLEIDADGRSLPLPRVFADPAQLEGALVNLALNSRDAMPRGGRLDITARERSVAAAAATRDLPEGRYVVFSVADTGLGMAQDVLVRAFEPFFTTKESGKGSGLGLSMVYGFVKQSGGHLAVQSELGYGTRMELFLPVAPDGKADAPAARSRPTQRGAETVLVVEDEPEVRGIAVAFLHSLGYSVHAAADADEAMTILRAQPGIALLFSDVVLGNGSNGIELAHAARELRPGLPVLLTSGYERVHGGTDDAASEYPLLRKPYRKEDLAAAVRDVLDRG